MTPQPHLPRHGSRKEKRAACGTAAGLPGQRLLAHARGSHAARQRQAAFWVARSCRGVAATRARSCARTAAALVPSRDEPRRAGSRPCLRRVRLGQRRRGSPALRGGPCRRLVLPCAHAWPGRATVVRLGPRTPGLFRLSSGRQ